MNGETHSFCQIVEYLHTVHFIKVLTEWGGESGESSHSNLLRGC